MGLVACAGSFSGSLCIVVSTNFPLGRSNGSLGFVNGFSE